MNDRVVKLAELWERISARGARYLSGFMGRPQPWRDDTYEPPRSPA
jgi:hypothetical protein